MAFSDYKHISQVQQQFRIKYREEQFITAPPVEPPPQFIEEFNFNKENLDLYASEASRAELIILPALREVYKPYAAHAVLWIQKPVNYDAMLNGTPDYLLATRSELGKTVLAMPLLAVAEAKRNDFEQGWGQCLAELVAGQKLNGDPDLAVYGIVTDGRRWEIGRLLGDTFVQNDEAYNTDDWPLLFGALHFIFQTAVKNGRKQ